MNFKAFTDIQKGELVSLNDLAEVQPITDELEQMGYSLSSIFVECPLLKNTHFNNKANGIKHYSDIYSDIKERFEILDI